MESLTEKVVGSASEAYSIFQEGNQNRTVGGKWIGFASVLRVNIGGNVATASNEKSSRSHSVFTLYIESKVEIQKMKTFFVFFGIDYLHFLGRTQWNY